MIYRSVLGFHKPVQPRPPMSRRRRGEATVILMAAPDSDPRRLAALLAWQAAAGADEAILEHAVDRYRTESPLPMAGFTAPKPSLPPPPAPRPAAARPAAASPVIAGARELAAAARSL